MKYTCPQCGAQHEELPAIGYNVPDMYDELTEEEQDEMGEANSDFCTINYPDGQTDYFIRTVLRIPVTDSTCQTLDYGLWVSLSEEAFNDYKEHYNTTVDRAATYIGYICNMPPGYDDEVYDVEVDVEVGDDSNRPFIHPLKEQQHPLVQDAHKGITLKEAMRRVQEVAQ